ncbi:MAG TPA: hypothetical protein VJ806_09020 [Luteimonas sp.]|nr:hypothetical protein [Luteimonas sp.]
MNKHLIAALLAIPAMFLAGQAFAQNNGGGWINGTQLNGLPTPGPVFQGTQINGVPTPGPVFQGTQINGVPTPGPALQGTQINGLPTPGPVFQGTQSLGLSAGPIVQGIQASVAPNWSALPASQLTVRLAPAI